MSIRPLLAVGLVLVAAVGCSSSPRKAAEPATAPATTAAPAGLVRSVGAEPEGIVYDATTGTVAVAVRSPDRLLLLDPSTLAVRRTVALPGSARHLQLAAPGGPVLVPAETADELVQVSLRGGPEVRTKVEKQPHDAAGVSGGKVVVGNEFGKSASVISDGKVVRTIRGLTQPGGVVGDGTIFGIVDVGAYRLDTYDLSTYRRSGTIAAGKGPTHGELIGGGRIAVADTRGNQLLIFDVSPLRQVGALALPGAPYGLAVDRLTDTVWVTLTGRNKVVGVAVSAPAPKVIASYDTVRQPNTVAVSPGSRSIWVTGTQAGVVQRISR
ncbi:YncE family protein [uncultured Jatrophihabitans sp.]|uniref:YncE family protein n=1 Tax=uncultured Jatrophihabitans sp. TaxID=1610747 RepID=UPI0035CB5F81